ncbi:MULTISPECIES: hypothetical protein [Mesorhizobium]|uniref:Uncharacterized protein n=1 Tax=Mesorhizobium ciceri TaxID=39645 RepID=A0AB38TKF8_9HYPH|nr:MULTISPECIES: hypothetical protein [Mesorhizobium]MDF3156159.1 hypothetical protein [Mesorhizobium sp. XAP10]MDF3217375.1 hypothetical protein [Mesorhizobium ciceri]MDF3248826.1 hypothetical protein [Mesorhizobium sp. XAP4]UTU55116.1 hypothetical protein LRP29_32780 [Mesorhizobium ciceri]
MIESGMRVTAHCARCNHSRTLDLEALRERCGADAPAMAADLAPKMRCSNCEQRSVGFSYTLDPTKHSGMGVSNPYAMAKDGR